MDNMKNKIKDYNLEANFKLLGWRNDIYRLMKTVDIFVLPTYYFEGLPVSILEAMSCSKPVVVTKHRGCEDAVIDGESGCLVPVKQPEALAEKINFLLDKGDVRIKMGQAARLRIEQNFELKLCTKKIIDALEKAME